MNKWRNLVLMLLVLVLVGCANKGQDKQKNNQKYAPPPPILEQTTTAPAIPCAFPCTSEPEQLPVPIKMGTKVNLPIKRLIYFEYDKSDITPEAHAILEKHATYLNKHPDAFVRLEGHTDERGSREYNLALAERRLEAARETLKILGVHDDQLMTLSYGEELPVSFDQEENAWLLNRRVELVYP